MMNRHERRAQEILRRQEQRASSQYGGKAPGASPETRVRVSHVLETDDNSQFFRVKLDSRVKAGRVMHIDVPILAEKIEKRIMLAAGAIAEALNNKYGDKLDPDLMAHRALAAFQDLMKRMELKEGGAGVSG